MSYFNKEAYDMLLILCIEVHSLLLKDCGGNVILIGLFTREMFFHVWLNEPKLKVSFSLNITKLHGSIVQLGMKKQRKFLQRQN